jgi:hypothetical protein
MPDIPEGAKTPSDHQTSVVKPEQHSPGWSLLRPPIDLELWEITDFVAIAQGVKMRGETVELNAANLRLIGQLTKIIQTVFANSSDEFKKELRSQGGFAEQATWILPLAMEYAAALGEAVGSAS